MSYLFQDPKFWLLISFITFIILMIKPFKSMMIGGLDSKIAEIKENINKSLESFTEAEAKLKDAEKQTEDLSNKIDEIIVNAKKQSESISKNIIDKTTLTIQSKEKTLEEKDLEQLHKNILEKVSNKFKAKIRT